MNETVIYNESFFQDSAVFENIPSSYQAFLTQNPIADILQVFKFDRDKAETFLSKLVLGEAASIALSQDNRQLLLRNYFSFANQLKAEGKTSLAIGYPFYFEKTERAVLNLPIAVFPIEISAEIAENESFNISPTQPTYIINYHLLDYLEKRYEIDFQEIKIRAAAQENFHQLMQSLGALLSLKLDLDFNYSANKIFPLLSPDSIAGEEKDKGIFSNAAIGVFAFPYEGFKKPDFDLIQSKNKRTIFLQGILPTDVAQRQALSQVNSTIHVIEGNAGTGKTHSVSNLASHLMSEGKKVLVISSRLKTLLQVQENLAKWNLDQYSFILKDLQNDYQALLNIARAIGTNIEEKEDKSLNIKAFELTTSQLRQQYNKLFNSYATLQKDLTMAKNWQYLVGMFLKANAVETREVLNVQLKAADFSFDNKEYQSLKHDVTTAHPLYNKIQTLEHELSNLHPSLFQGMSKTEAENYIQNQIALFNGKLSSLHREHLFVLERFRQQQRALYQVRYSNLTSSVDKIASQIDAGAKLYNGDFQSTGLWSSFLSIFSKRQREIRRLQGELKNNYEILVRTHQDTKSFSFEFPSISPSKPNKIAKIVKDFSGKLNIWNTGVDTQVEREVQQLEAESKQADEQIKQIDTVFSSFLNDFNQSNLYKQNIERLSHSIADNRKTIQQIREQLEKTNQAFKDFDAFYDWQRFWLNVDSKSQNVIAGLIRSDASHWQNALDSWYFHWVLQGNYQSIMPQEHTDVKGQILENANELSLMLATQIDALSHKRRLEGMRANRKRRLFDKENFKAYQSLTQLFEYEHSTLTEFFPVLMATPAIANQVFRQSEFDCLIFDDAQDVLAEQCGNIVTQASQIYIFGDSFNIHLKDNSLLYHALQWKEKSKAEIAMIHTTKSGGMNAFLDAIYPSESLRLPVLSHQDFFILENTMGRYDEALSINPVEAEHVLMLLNDIKKLPNNRYPSVGILTSTYEQRDLIANMLLKIKQKRTVGVEKIQQLERNNFGVFHWSEAVGLHFDIVIVSFTYGIKDTKGKVSREIQLINDDKGIESLYQMLTSATQKLYWCNSIPQNYFDEFFEAPYAKGTYLLSAIVKYFQALKKEDQTLASTILNNTAHAMGAVRRYDENPLIEEIYQQLNKVVPQERLVQSPSIGSLSVPLMIRPLYDNQPTLILRLDGTFTLPLTPDPVWEQVFIDKMKTENYQLLESWSVNWWRNPQTETQRLLSELERFDATYLKVMETIEPSEAIIEEETINDLSSEDDKQDDKLPQVEIAQQVTDNEQDEDSGHQPTEA
jgi:hypothetical protein